MSSLVVTLLAAILLLIAPNRVHATPIDGPTPQDAGHTHGEPPMTGGDLLAPGAPNAGKDADAEDLDEVEAQLHAEPIPADKERAAGSGPTAGALWLYALGGCTAVGMVAFRGNGREE